MGLSRIYVEDDKIKFRDSENTTALTLSELASVSEITETTITSSATPTPVRTGQRSFYSITALAEAATFAAPSGTPVNGDMLLIRIKDNGTARALTWNAIYDGLDDTLPSTTTLGKVMYILFIYNSASSKWEMLSVKVDA